MPTNSIHRQTNRFLYYSFFIAVGIRDDTKFSIKQTTICFHP